MAKTGRPKLEINKKQFETSIQLPINKESIAKILGCSERTLDAWIKEEYDTTNRFAF